MSSFVWVCIILAAIVVVAVLLWQWGRSRQTPSTTVGAPAATPRDPFAPDHDAGGDPRTLKAGDMIDMGGQRTWVRGSLRFAEGGSTWAEHFLEMDNSVETEQGTKRWLSVEEDPDLRLALWTGRPELELTPHSDTIELEGVRYRLAERGTASYRSEGTTGLRAQGGADYADYEGPTGQYLAFERFDHGRWEASVGTAVAPGEITIYPGG